MKNFWMGLIGVALLAGAGCFRNTVSPIELHIPAMASQGCADRVLAAIQPMVKQEGDLKPVVDLEKRVITAHYNNVELGRRNIELAIARAGFDVNDWPADATAKAKLPAECRGE